MRRALSLILAVVLLISCLGALTGCKKKKAIPDHEVPDELTGASIVFYHSFGQTLQGILDKAIEEFNEIYPSIKVEHKYIGNYDAVRDQVSKDITVGKAPNLALCYPDHVALYNIAGATKAMDAFETHEKWGFTQEQLDDFVPGYYNEGKAYEDGKMYTLPISKSTEVLYYNKTFFNKHSLEVPETWDDMEKLCEKIKELDSDSVPLGYDSEANWFITMCEQLGSPYTSASGEKFLFNNETNRDFVNRFRTWYEKKWVTTGTLCGGYTSDYFKTGTSYMTIGSTGGATYQKPKQVNGVYEFEVGIAPIPQIDPSNSKVISQGPSICMFKNEDAQEELASWLFAKFLSTNLNFQMRVSIANGYVPVIKSAMEQDVYKEFLNSASTDKIQAYAVKVATEQTEAYYASPVFNGSSEARDQVGLLLQACLCITGSDAESKIKKEFESAVEECKYQSE